ncbi:aminotransferase class V-fold PLP-dependent enzyme [Bradyrhizobium sp. BR 10289]|uniref:aminotransferase class V-fold PLP-dependent enzyme n=1 Tax=Bradyrhizobium sp. BR 10289 TaxID=2749993 RepID=UPI001C65219D|nr:aminotransferase class V-fold PLP-dependent enzyme [Bradyrhizobium sp. BR 10289]MBW7970557.1 aminotransferase class V-fold PLP-dependent enzyme [Bradyrhizobium sp. BR 10289]
MRIAPSRDHFDAAAFRADTPGTATVVHLNAAGAGLPPRIVTETVMRHLAEEASVGPHWAAARAADDLHGVRAAAAELLQCRPHNVAFGGSAGTMWAMAFLAMPVKRRSRVLVARSEWAGNVLNLMKRREADAITIDIMPVDERTGRIDVRRVADLIDERTVAICLPVAASGFGVRQPVELLAALPRPEGCLLLVDGAQAVGQFPLGMANTGADVLVAPSRKWLRGPRGEAIMALSDRALERLGDPPVLSQAGSSWTAIDSYATRADARRFETYEFSVAGRLGLGAAITHVLQHGIENIRDLIRARLVRIHAGLTAIPGVTVFEDDAAESAFLTFTTDALAPAELNDHLAEANIAAAVVDRGYARADLEARGLEAVNRVAPHAYTSEEDIDRFLDAVSGASRRTCWRNAS